MEYYQQDTKEILKELKSSPEKGLENTQVETRAKTYGPNALTQEERDPWQKMLLRQFTGMLIYILVAAAVISAVLGEWIDFVAIIVILAVNGILGFVQEYKAQTSIQALKKMASSKANVVRAGKTVQVPAEELVPGDIIILQTGDRVPADSRIIECSMLEADEGALTGESTTVAKNISKLKGQLPLGDQKNMVFSGTIITKGHGRAVVVATGMKTQIGSIATMIQQAPNEQTPLQKRLDKLGSRIGEATIAVCAVVFALILFLNQEFTFKAVTDAFRLGVSLAVAAVPEGLPIVVTIALAFGTQRMVKRHALIKRLPATETLGSTTVICTDKTGTLTKNEMTVTKVHLPSGTVEVEGIGYSPEGKIEKKLPEELVNICALCNDSELTKENGKHIVIGDPTEGCLVTLARKADADEKELRKLHPRLGEVPFDSERKRMSTVHEIHGKKQILTKGAPDVILKLCTKIKDGKKVRKITKQDKQAILLANQEYGEQALRVLAFAYKPIDKKSKYGPKDEKDLIFVGLAGMIDPARNEAKKAVETCKKAGIRVVMITGDHKVTAMAIAKELGIEGKAVEGADIKNLDLHEEVDHIGIYARVNPEHKMLIIDALKEKGEIVAMTGDGVNDAPALKRADIGVAMGITGTDVAKESAAMILTDDNFASIVSAVEEGRNIFTNIKKFVNYLLSSNLAEVLVIFFSVLLFSVNGHAEAALTVPMLLYINLLTDSLPALALGVDPGNPNVMQQPPRTPGEPIITKNMAFNILGIGVLVAAATLFVYWQSLSAGETLSKARTMALSALVVLEIVRLAMIRQQYKTPFFSNKWLFVAIGVVLILQLAVVYIPFMQAAFSTSPLALADWTRIAITAAATYVVGMAIGQTVKSTTGQTD